MTSRSARAAVSGQAPDIEALRSELEATQRSFRELARSLSREEWRKPSANPAWTAGQLMYHVAWGLSFVPGAVARAKRGRGFDPPAFLRNPANVLLTRWGARRATPRSVVEQYDAGMIHVLGALAGVTGEEWQRGAMSFGQFLTVEGLFRSVISHFEEHAAQIQSV